MRQPPPRRIADFVQRPGKLSKIYSVWQHCSKCGVGYCLATGYNATTFDRAKLLKTLVECLCWQVAPTILCTSCASTVDIRLILEGRRMLKGIEEGGNDGADIAEFEGWHERLLEDHPGKQKYIDKLLFKKNNKSSYAQH